MNIYSVRPICPFCATELSIGKNLAFSKLIMQTESGLRWDDNLKANAVNKKGKNGICRDSTCSEVESELEELISSQIELFKLEEIEKNKTLNHDLMTKNKDCIQNGILNPQFPKYIPSTLNSTFHQ
jgi:hypothetical protein